MADDLLTSDASENSEESQTLNLRKTLFRECSMVVIRDVQLHNDCSVFPPVNHENLRNDISASPPSSSSPSSSLSSAASSFSPSDTDSWGPSSSLPSDSLVHNTGGFTEWVTVGFEILRSKLFAVVSLYRNFASKKGAIWSIGAAALVLSWWMYIRAWGWLKQRRRRRENRLMTIIKEKDEKIAQLLDRIVQMNELLIARHKALVGK